MSINDIYNNYAKLSFVDKNNFYGKLYPNEIDKLFINCSDIDNFYNDTYIYLHLYSSLFFELYKNNNDNNNNITNFNNLIKNLNIKIINSDTNNIGELNKNTNTYIFNLDAVKNYNISNDKYYNYEQITNYIKPILNNINININSNSNFKLNDLYSINNIEYNISTIKKTDEIKNKNILYNKYDNIIRKNKLFNIIYEILSQPHENILSYLLYYKIYYHIIFYNIIIQKFIRENYLNNSSNNLDNKIDSKITDAIVDIFKKMSDNIYLIDNNFLNFKSNDYIKDKYEYTLKIANLNSIRDEYKRIENNLNNIIRQYNKYIKNFKTIKTFGNFIIILLIIIIIITIIITLLGNLSFNFKNYYYLITFIILSIIVYIYYNKFKYINLYEKFQINCNEIIAFDPDSYNNKKNHADFYNSIFQSMNNYNKKIKDTFDNLKTNIYTIGNKVFSQDANIYLYNLYKEKKQQNDANRIKQISLSNMLENLRKEVVYLFNIILVISLLTLILLFGLLIYINFPFFLTYIIILCIILFFIVIVYFMIAIVQPTRMVANKNYWANQNPSKNLLVKL